MRSILDAEAIGRFEPIGEDDQFDMEYWSLEQAKLGKTPEKRLARHVVVVTGGAGAIGAATAKAFAREGADVAILDIDAEGVAEAAKSIGPNALGLRLRRDRQGSRSRPRSPKIVETFGGVDILVSNAGAAMTGMIAEMPDEVLRQSFEINFFSHQNVARAAVAIMKRQKLGGMLLFNVSKQAVNPGREFRRLWHLEGGAACARASIRAGARQGRHPRQRAQPRPHPLGPSDAADDRKRAPRRAASPRPTIWPAICSASRSRPQDVAEAFVAQALMRKTTGDVMTVDGGNVAAMMR